MIPSKRQSGFAIIEVAVTILIITVAISGMGLLLLRAVQSTQDSSQQSQAMWIVEDYVGRLRANPEGAKGRFYELSPEDIDCRTPPDNLCAETYQANNEVAAADCSFDRNSPGENKMAEFDNWISTCGLAANAYDSPSDFIVNPRLTSVCTATSNRVTNYTGQEDCVEYLVTLKWQTKINKASVTESERIQENEYSMAVRVN